MTVDELFIPPPSFAINLLPPAQIQLAAKQYEQHTASLYFSSAMLHQRSNTDKPDPSSNSKPGPHIVCRAGRTLDRKHREATEGMPEPSCSLLSQPSTMEITTSMMSRCFRPHATTCCKSESSSRCGRNRSRSFCKPTALAGLALLSLLSALGLELVVYINTFTYQKSNTTIAACGEQSVPEEKAPNERSHRLVWGSHTILLIFRGVREAFLFANWIDMAPAVRPIHNVLKIAAGQALKKLIALAPVCLREESDMASIIVHHGSQSRLSFCQYRSECIPLRQSLSCDDLTQPSHYTALAHS